MPRLTLLNPKYQEVTRQGDQGDWGLVCKCMEEVQEDGEGEPAERQKPESSPNHTPANIQPQQTSWPQTLGTLRPWKEWYSFALVGVVWSFCQVEALPHPFLSLMYVCWRLLLMCLLWLVLGGCIHILECCLWQEQKQGEAPPRIEREVVTENRTNQCSWMSQSRSPVHTDPLALALANSLLLCVLQEPLSDPSVPNIKSLVSRLESVSHTLENAVIGSEATPDQDPVLADKVKLIHNYLQQRMRLLCRLVQVQGDLETSVRDMLMGLEGLWARLELLHTGVTLTKQSGRGREDLASAQTDSETFSSVLGYYRSRLQHCQTHLKSSTQLLQELTWSHTNISNKVSCSSESVWPELLLQSNIEQFDKVQERFLSLEQQTTTFQAHLDGLGKGDQGRYAGPLTHANATQSAPSQMSDVSLEHCNSTSASTSSPPADAEPNGPLSLFERSALQFSSTIGRLRKSGRRK